MIAIEEIILLVLLSGSGTLLLYLIYSQYRRVEHFQYLKDVLFPDGSELEELLKEQEDVQKEDFLSKVKKQLTHAGIKLPSIIFLMFVAVFTFALGAVLSLFLKSFAGFIIGLPIALFFTYSFVKMLIEMRTKEFNAALSIAISTLVKMMKNGIGFEQALYKSITISNSKLLKSVFTNFFQEKNTIGEVEAFTKMYELIDSKELQIFALAIKIGRESGGQFSNTLTKVDETIRYRKKMQDKVDVVTREGSVGSYVVVAIAILLYYMLNSNFGGKIHHYFMTSEFGRFELLAIMLWIIIGMFVNGYITKVKR